MKKSTVKLIAIAIIIAAITIALGIATSWFRNWNVKTWFNSWGNGSAAVVEIVDSSELQSHQMR